VGTRRRDRVGGDFSAAWANSVDCPRLRSVPPPTRLTALFTLSHIQRRPYSLTGIWIAWR
jgi:hypothetical protein